MKVLRHLIVVVSFLIITSNTYAQTEIDSIKYNKIPTSFIGLSLSLLSSIGISYHTMFDNTDYPTCLKFTLLVTPDDLSEKDIRDQMKLYFGIELQYNIYHNQYYRLYALWANGYYGDFLTIGPGSGYEIFIGTLGLAFNVDIGFVYINYFNKKTQYSPSYGFGVSYGY